MNTQSQDGAADAEQRFSEMWAELERLAEPYLALKRLRRERPWAFDIARVLWPRPNGVHIEELEQTLLEIRKSELPTPKQLRKTIQSCLNHHTSQSQVFWNKRRGPADDLFWTPRRFSGIWCVHRDRFEAWITAKGLDPV
jgi:hypothetical protein